MRSFKDFLGKLNDQMQIQEEWHTNFELLELSPHLGSLEVEDL
jgi:hypothetical protein